MRDREPVVAGVPGSEGIVSNGDGEIAVRGPAASPERRGDVHQAQPEALSVAGIEHARFEEVLGRRIVGRGIVPAHASDEVVALEEHPQRTVGAGRQPGEIPDHDLLAARGVIAPVLPQRVDRVPVGSRCAVRQGNVDRPVRFALFEGAEPPERPRAMQVADAFGDESLVDLLDQVVAGGRIHAIDAPAAIVAVVKLYVGGIDRVAAQYGGHCITEALVDGRLGRPQRRDRPTSIPHVDERPGHDAPDQALPPVLR